MEYDKPSTKHNDIRLSSNMMPLFSPTIAYMLCTDEPNSEAAMNNYVKTTVQVQDYIYKPLTEAYDVRDELNHIERNFKGFTTFDSEQFESKPLIGTLIVTETPSKRNVFTGTEFRSTEEKIKFTSTKRSTTTKTNPDEPETKSKPNFKNVKVDVTATTRSQRFTKMGKTSWTNKKATPTAKGIPQANLVFKYIDKAIITPIDNSDKTMVALSDAKTNDASLVQKFKNTNNDYFNDLLVWHNDTLNKNIGDTFWDRVRDFNENNYIMSAKLAGITKEVDMMNKYLSTVEVLPRGNVNKTKMFR